MPDDERAVRLAAQSKPLSTRYRTIGGRDLMAAVAGIDSDQVSAWCAAHIAGCRPPLDFALISGGHSNLSYEVTDAHGLCWVLRRPPLGHVLPTAHDMQREHRILSAVQGTPVPVPGVVGLCLETEVNGAPFYVMNKVDGYVLRDREAVLAALTEPRRRRAGLELADTLAAIHQLRPTEIGLGDLGRPENYVARQLRRWKRQLDDSRTRPLPVLYDVHDRLSARIPEQVSTGLVHGDFRLDNCVVGPDGSIRAVLDWELCTQGDTLADLGALLVSWAAPDAPHDPLDSPPTLAPGFPTRQEMIGRYAAARDMDPPDIGYYGAFAYWRLACIVEGVYARYLHGDMGDRTEEAVRFEQRVLDLGDAAAAILDRW